MAEKKVAKKEEMTNEQIDAYVQGLVDKALVSLEKPIAL